MSLRPQSSFSAGELDPALHERTNFDKYQTGLATLRNSFIGKTGRPISRPGTLYDFEPKANATAPNTIFTALGYGILSAFDHVLGAGTQVRLTTTGTLPTGFATGTDYWVSRSVSREYFYLAVSFSDAMAGAYVNTLLDFGTGVHTAVPVDVGTKKSIIFSPPYTKYVIEFGHRYVRIHDVINGGFQEAGHAIPEDDLPYVQFEPSGLYVYIFCKGYDVRKMVLGNLTNIDADLYNRFVIQAFAVNGIAIASSSSSGGPPTGYDVEYVATLVNKGQEGTFAAQGSGFKLPVTAGHFNTFNFTSLPLTATEVRMYRRPKNGQAFGYIGAVGVYVTGSFTDWGQEADYTHSPPTQEFYPPYKSSRTGLVYQNRLLVTDDSKPEAIYASRTNYPNNFFRDYPLGADSSLSFKTGSSGTARVLRFLDNGGLLAFTTVGIYQNSGPLSPDNLSMDKKGNWVIEETVPALEVPGGILFVDKSTNTIRSLIFSNEAGGYPGEELSIFSNHLFVNKTVVSWAFQDGDTPLIWVVMDDGSLLSLTYQREHQMRAWARHDSNGDFFECVTVVKSLSAKSDVYFQVLRGGKRIVEKMSPRFQNDIKNFCLMDSAKSFGTEYMNYGPNIGSATDAYLTAVAHDFNYWDGLINISSDQAIFTNTPDNGAVGSIFRVFDSQGAAVDLQVTVIDTFNQIITVQPLDGVQFNSSETTGFKLYKTHTELTGLDHLEGRFVSLLVDGYVEASPLNNIENYPLVQVVGGKVTLPGGKRGAITFCGLPFASDIETLDISTIEQKPTVVEDMIVNKIYLKVYNSRGLFVGSKFPENNYVSGMTNAEERYEDIEFGNIGNSAQKLTTKRLEIVPPNDWKTKGKICIRQVDPLPFEILSIIPELSTS